MHQKWKILLLLVWITSAAIGQNTGKKSQLDQRITAILDSCQTVGAIVAVVYKDHIEYLQGFGYRDLAAKLEVNENTLFPIGSCSKAFTAALIGQLTDSSDFHLQQKISKYLPDIQFYSSTLTEQVTIQDVLAHRTGLPRHDLSWYLFPSKSPEVLMKRLRYLEPFTGLRERYHYNNFGYLLAGEVITQYKTKNWNQLVQNQLFKPLQMSRSCTDLSSLQQDTNSAIGYEHKTTELMAYYDVQGMAAAGSINSSGKEMATWLQLWINGGKNQDGKQIIPAAFVQAAMSSQMIMRAELPTTDFPSLHFKNYGYAWMLSSYKGHYRVEHGGNINGFSANVCFFPSDSIGIVVLTNQQDSPVPYLLRNTLADEYLSLEKTDWLTDYQNSQSTASDEETEVAQPVKPFTEKELLHAEGSYIHLGYGTIQIIKKGKQLVAVFPLGTYPLQQLSQTTFQLITTGASTPIPPLSIEFSKSVEGKITQIAIQLEPMLNPIIFEKAD